MKNIFALFLSAVLIFPLAACGGGTEDGGMSNGGTENVTQKTEPLAATKKEMLDQAAAVSMSDMIQNTLDDQSRAAQLYCNKILIVEGDITEMCDNDIAIGSFDVAIQAALSNHDLANLEIGQRITIVGKTGNEIQTGDALHTVSALYDMQPAFLVKDTVEWTGEFKGLNGGNDGSYNIKIGDSSTLRRIYFADGVPIPERDTEITVSGRCIDNDLCNAIIIN